MDYSQTKKSAGIFLLFAGLALLNQPAHSQSTNASPTTVPTPAPLDSTKSAAPFNNGFSGTAVLVGGTPIMRVRFAAGGFTAEQRAATIQVRVNKLLDHGPVHPSDIYTQDYDATDTGVYVNGHLLFMADSATARYNKMSAHDLAESWAAAMRRMLPALTRDEDASASPGN